MVTIKKSKNKYRNKYRVSNARKEIKRINAAYVELPSIKNKSEYENRLNDFKHKISECKTEIDNNDDDAAIAILESIDPVEYLNLAKSAVRFFDTESIKDVLENISPDSAEYKNTVEVYALKQYKQIYEDYSQLFDSIGITGNSGICDVLKSILQSVHFGGIKLKRTNDNN